MKDTRDIATLKNWSKNPRSIKEKDFDRLKKQIFTLGQYKPLLITNDGIVLGGNMRLRAYRELGINEVWVSIVDADTEDKKLEYALSDNDRAGFYDGDLLANLVPNYPDFDWSSYAVDLKEPQSLDDLLDQFKEVDEDEAPPLAEGEADSKLGEVYQLGRHRLMCGDATKIEDVEKLMDGQKADMVWTDPPYNVAYEGNNWSSGHIKTGKPDWEGGIKNDKQSRGEFRQFLMDSYVSIDSALIDGGSIYICYPSGKDGWDFIYAFDELDWHFQSTLVWKKGHLLISRWDYHPIYEPILYGWKGKNHNFYGERNQSNILEHGSAIRQHEAGMHPTQKPISLISKCIKNNTQSKNNSVLDLFGGSGSTLIACEQTNRTCYMMELDPKYCDVIRKRYQNYIDNSKGATNG